MHGAGSTHVLVACHQRLGHPEGADEAGARVVPRADLAVERFDCSRAAERRGATGCSGVYIQARRRSGAMMAAQAEGSKQRWRIPRPAQGCMTT